MHNHLPIPVSFLFAIILVVGLACSLPGLVTQPTPQAPTEQVLQVIEVTATAPQPTATIFSGESNLPELPTATSTPVITYVDFPLASIKKGGVVFDVDSSGTAPEKRAPYGDSYHI